MFNFFSKKQKIDENIINQLEESLILSDVGLPMTANIIRNLRKNKLDKEISPEELSKTIKEIILEDIQSYFVEDNLLDKIELSGRQPYVIMISGVNGSGKTTSIAKFSKLCANENLKVLLAPCDTFRAAAQEQLQYWAEVVGVDFYNNPNTKQPAALAYQALEHAINNKYDVLIIDTAGRLDNNTGLMEELTKIQQTIKKLIISAPHDSVLVLDGTIGQASHYQAINFLKYIDITGLIITKLDSQSKGGTLINTVKQLNVPIFYQCTGEQLKDIHPFNLQNYINNILK